MSSRWGRRFGAAVAVVCLSSSLAVAVEDSRVGELYQRHCAECHGTDRLGGTGLALLPESLQRLKQADALAVIANGRPATQMPAFAQTLGQDELAALVDLIYRPLPTVPDWSIAEIEASRIVHAPPSSLPAMPVHHADPLNLFTIVEAGDHHVTILDGDRFEPLWRFPSRFALHGGAKYSPDGRFVYLGSRDGWISKYDLWGLQPVAEARAGLNLRNIAVSADGRWVMAGNLLPSTLVILDAADLKPVKVIPVDDGRGTRSRVSAVYTAPPRSSFLIALKDVPQLWEVSYAENPPPVPKGFLHNYEPGMLEGAFDRGAFPVRRIALDQVLDDFFCDQDYRTVIGASRDGARAQVVNVNIGQAIAAPELPDMPHLASGITFRHEGRPVLATPHLKEAVVSIIDMIEWRTIRRVTTSGPGFFLRSHENSPYAWTDASLGEQRDTIHIIDKRTLEITRTLRPEPGKTAAHVEFTRDGRFALVSVWETDGAVVVYDAATFEVVKRIPMVKPSGKYNVYNKITYDAGTSH
jgi:Cytochrome D1 heme domain/Cytochrome C oxidase, cbb3-type, subunit III